MGQLTAKEKAAESALIENGVLKEGQLEGLPQETRDAIAGFPDHAKAETAKAKAKKEANEKAADKGGKK